MSLLDLFKKKGSGDVAKDRLKLLLVSDRANCSPEVMEMIKNDIIKVISKYMVIDAEELDIQIIQLQIDNSYSSYMCLCVDSCKQCQFRVYVKAGSGHGRCISDDDIYIIC